MKKKLIHKQILIKNILISNYISDDTIKKIDNIVNITKTIIYPAHLNLNNKRRKKYTITKNM